MRLNFCKPFLCSPIQRENNNYIIKNGNSATKHLFKTEARQDILPRLSQLEPGFLL